MSEESERPYAFEVRANMNSPMPRHAVTARFRNGTSEDVAWFYRFEDAKEYTEWLRQKTHPPRKVPHDP